MMSPPSSPRGSREFHIAKSPSGNVTMNVDEDLTMIKLPHQPNGSDKENETRQQVNGKGDMSPRQRTRTNSRDDQIGGPLTTFTKDLKKSNVRF